MEKENQSHQMSPFDPLDPLTKMYLSLRMPELGPNWTIRLFFVIVNPQRR